MQRDFLFVWRWRICQWNSSTKYCPDFVWPDWRASIAAWEFRRIIALVSLVVLLMISRAKICTYQFCCKDHVVSFWSPCGAFLKVYNQAATPIPVLKPDPLEKMSWSPLGVIAACCFSRSLSGAMLNSIQLTFWIGVGSICSQSLLKSASSTLSRWWNGWAVESWLVLASLNSLEQRMD